MDYVGYHPYSHPNGPDYTSSTPSFAELTAIKEIMRSNGDGNKQIMATEVGWPTHTSGVDEPTQAYYVRRVFQKIMHEDYPHVAIACVYDFLDDGTDKANAEHNFGLIRADYSEKPAYAAMLAARDDYDANFVTVVVGPSVTAQNITAFAGTAFSGQVATGTYSGQGSLSATINWGDGSGAVPATVTITSPGNFTVSGSHTYANTGSFPLTVVVTNTITGTGFTSSATATSSSTATVVVGPSVTAQNITAFAGTAFSGQVATGTYSGQGSLSATINWGDGSGAVPATVTITSPGNFTVSGTHTYANTGSFPLTVTVNDTSGHSFSDSSTATVVAVPTVTAQNITAFAATAFSSQVATGTYSGSGTLSATVNWGDGGGPLPATVTITSPGNFTVSGSHTYASTGSFPLTVAVTNTFTGTGFTSSAIATGTSTATVVSLVTAINAGGGATVNFVADTDYNTGNAYSDTSSSINTSGVSESIPQAVWQTCRWNSSFTYTIPALTAGASYTVALDWAELTWTAAGKRVFNVAINGTAVLSNFDVYAQVGYKTALQKQFTATANSSGQIVIAFTQGSADNPFINGIEIYR
jgi:hypothetical protein